MAVLFVLAFVTAQLLAAALPGDGVLSQWLYALTHNSVLGIAAASTVAAVLIHLIVGIVWAVLYAFVFESRLPGNAAVRGMTFALLPWVLSLVVFLPLVGGGFLGLAIGAGPLPILGNLVLHLAYGFTLGVTYGPLSEMPADDFSRTGIGDDLEVRGRYERRGAWGLLIGGVLGTILGLVIVALQPGTSPYGLSPLFIVPVAMLLGAAFGGWWGSVAGLNAIESASPSATSTSEKARVRSQAHPSYTDRPNLRALEWVALVILLGLFALCLMGSFIVGPILLFPLIILGYLAFGAGQLVEHDSGRRNAATTQATALSPQWETLDIRELEIEESHTNSPAVTTPWGQITRVLGTCPNGITLRPGQQFTVTNGAVSPDLCVHARRVILAEATRMTDEEIVTETRRYHDADHAFEIELHQANEAWPMAA